MAKRKRKTAGAPIDGDGNGNGDGDLNSKPEKEHDCNRKRKRTEAPTGGDGGGDLNSKSENHEKRKREIPKPPAQKSRRKRRKAPKPPAPEPKWFLYDDDSKPVSRKSAKILQLKGDKMIASVMGDNRIEDVQWLCSLSESELDMLIYLKMMVFRKAKKIQPGFEADMIDLKLIHDLSIAMMKNVKEELKKDHLAPSCDCASAESWKQIDESKLSQVNVKEFSSMTIEELWPFIRPNITGRTKWDK